MDWPSSTVSRAGKAVKLNMWFVDCANLSLPANEILQKLIAVKKFSAVYSVTIIFPNSSFLLIFSLPSEGYMTGSLGGQYFMMGEQRHSKQAILCQVYTIIEELAVTLY